LNDTSQTAVVFKVENGTVNSSENLCATCRCATRRTGALSGRITFICEANYQNPVPLREPMARCNRYLDASRPSLQEMREIAWELATTKAGRAIGFISPEESARRRQSFPPSTPGFGG
jgi:hypothetical protein